MCCKNFGKKFAPFVLTFLLGLLAVSLLHRENSANTKRENIKPLKETVGSGGGSGDGTSLVEQRKSGTGAANRSGMNNVLIHSTPRADYTDEARQNNRQGVVRLRVTFLASGKIGAVTPVGTILPDGLTEQAIGAAKRITFEPARRDGVPINVTKIVEYSFTPY